MRLKQKKESNSTKKIKDLNANTTDPVKQKVVSCEEWTNFNTYEKSVYTNLSIERLGKELIAWARNNPDAIRLGQFLEEKGIHRRSWNRWCDKYDDLKEAYEHMKMIIGNRREFGIMTRKYENTSTAFMMMHYDQDWVDTWKLKTAVTNKDASTEGGNRVIVIEKYPDSPLVPHKKETE